MIPKPLEKIDAADIRALVANGDEERRTLDFKRDLPGATDADKRELRADVTSFANSAGGDLIFGIAETAGAATALPGLPGIDPDAEIRRLEEVINAGIDPRVPGFASHKVQLPGAGPVIVLRVPKSWRGPHLVKVNDAYRMFGRTSKGKYIMDGMEIRAAFAQSEDLPQQMRRWRDERLTMVKAGQTPMPMPAEGTLVLHLLPLLAFTGREEISAKTLIEASRWFSPLYAEGPATRINADGLLTYSTTPLSERVARTTCQVFRDGRIEAVWASLVRTQAGESRIHATAIEKALMERLPEYIHGLQTVGIPMPISVHCSVLGAKGALIPNPADEWGDNKNVVDRDRLLLPELLLESAVDIGATLRPVFDAIWNAGGWLASPSYGSDGAWKQLRY